MSATESVPARSRTPLFLWLIPAVLIPAAWLVGALWPPVLVRLGIFDYGTRFLDSYAVLAALDAVRGGADPLAANPLDPLMRNHVYSGWWLELTRLGLTREHNLLVGLTWVAAFAGAAWITMRPRRWGEMVWLVVLLVSPAVSLIVSRANNDLVIFVLLAGCGVAAAGGGAGWRLVVALSCLILATGLKYYPAVAALAFLWVRPVRRMPVALLVALLAAVLVLASVWSDVARGRFMIGAGVYTMGAPIWWRDLGWKDAQSALPGLMLIVLVASLLVRLRLTTGLADRGELKERLLAAMGALVILGCFVAGVNYAYRWIFLLWPAFWLWRRSGDRLVPLPERRIAMLGCGLVVLAFWQDGLFCAFVNALPPRTSAWIDQAQLTFRLWTQPLQWLLMGLLAGWLLEAALGIAREWWTQRHDQPAT